MMSGQAVWRITRALLSVVRLDILKEQRKQKSVTLSTTKAEYTADSMAFSEAVWFLKLFSEMFVHMMNTTVNICDNQRWDSIIEESRI